MSKELHLFKYYCGANYFNRTLSKQESNTIDYIWFPLDFADSYLPRDNSMPEVIKAIFARPIHRDNGTLFFYDHRIPELKRCKTYLEFILAVISWDFSQYDRIYYWLEKDSRSYLALCYLCSFINNKNLFIVPVENFHPELEYSTFSHVSINDFQSKWHTVKDQATPIEKPYKMELIREWAYWQKSEAFFRVMVNGRIEAKPEDFLDDYLKKAVRNAWGRGNRWFKVVSLAAEMQPYEEFKGRNGWGYFSERLSCLCEAGEVQVCFLESGETGNLFENNQ